jgi:hypothetical protein
MVSITWAKVSSPTMSAVRKVAAASQNDAIHAMHGVGPDSALRDYYSTDDSLLSWVEFLSRARPIVLRTLRDHLEVLDACGVLRGTQMQPSGLLT